MNAYIIDEYIKKDLDPDHDYFCCHLHNIDLKTGKLIIGKNDEHEFLQESEFDYIVYLASRVLGYKTFRIDYQTWLYIKTIYNGCRAEAVCKNCKERGMGFWRYTNNDYNSRIKEPKSRTMYKYIDQENLIKFINDKNYAQKRHKNSSP